MFKAVLQRHSKMLFDLERTAPLIQAIQKKVKPGDIVVDVGCGLGVLSLAAVKAGAKRVYAIDVDSEALEFARWQAKKLGVDKKICWLNDHSYNIDLVEKADLLIQETIGRLAFDENFLPTLQDAKKRFLKKGGEIIPEAVSLHGAPSAKNKKLLQKPALLAQIKTKTTRLTTVAVEKRWKTSGRPAGFLVWPKVVWAKGCQTDASPFKNPTHWRQTFLPYGARHPVVKNRILELVLKIQPHPKNPLYNTLIEWQIR